MLARSHYANPWPVSDSSPPSCFPCGNVKRIDTDDPRRASCEPCADAKGGGTECIGTERSCECAGGERGEAMMCAAEGYFLLVDREMEAAASKADAL